MTSAVVVRAIELSKTYRVPIAHDEVPEAAAGRRGWLSRGRRRPATRPFTAVDSVSFDVAQGEAVGLVGRNGAGKSTLLRILSRVTKPTSGMADVYGNIGALLEVGTGFHPDLSGRENVYLSGAILGMSTREVSSRFDEIVAFSELERFIDTPVKHYSSGMYARLGFAVAAHLRPALLIVDEVLSVGDLAFQAKCLARMQLITTEGTAVLFVSHNLQAVADFCERSLLMVDGVVVSDGSTPEIIKEYRHSLASKMQREQEAEEPSRLTVLLNGSIVEGVASHDPRKPMRVEVRRPAGAIDVDIDAVINLLVESMDGHALIHLRSSTGRGRLRLEAGNGSLGLEIEELMLSPGDYWVWLRLVSLDANHPGIWDSERFLLTLDGSSDVESLMAVHHHFLQSGNALPVDSTSRLGDAV